MRKSLREERLGQKVVLPDGLVAEIVEYKSSDDMVVLFSSGERVHTTYANLMRRLPTGNAIAGTKISRLGEVKVMNCGEAAKIIEYFGCENVTVQFSSGIVKKRVHYKYFKNGTLTPYKKGDLATRHIGEKRLMKSGEYATLIRYGGYKDIDLRFDNGVVREHLHYNNFVGGTYSSKNVASSRLGTVHTLRDGSIVKVVGYKGCNNVIIEFEDGTRRKTYWQLLIRGTVPLHTLNSGLGLEVIGTVYKANCGMLAEVVEYKDLLHVTVKFEDGTIADVSIYNLKSGEFAHPLLRHRHISFAYEFHGIRYYIYKYNGIRCLGTVGELVAMNSEGVSC